MTSVLAWLLGRKEDCKGGFLFDRVFNSHSLDLTIKTSYAVKTRKNKLPRATQEFSCDGKNFLQKLPPPAKQ